MYSWRWTISDISDMWVMHQKKKKKLTLPSLSTHLPFFITLTFFKSWKVPCFSFGFISCTGVDLIHKKCFCFRNIFFTVNLYFIILSSSFCFTWIHGQWIESQTYQSLTHLLHHHSSLNPWGQSCRVLWSEMSCCTVLNCHPCEWIGTISDIKWHKLCKSFFFLH